MKFFESWGLYNNFNFDKKDKAHMERVHLKSCKLYLILTEKPQIMLPELKWEDLLF